MSMRDDTRSTIQTQRQYEHDVQQDDDNKDCIRLQNQICSIWISATRPSYGGQSALAVPTTVPGALHSLCFISYSLCLLECTLLSAAIVCILTTAHRRYLCTIDPKNIRIRQQHKEHSRLDALGVLDKSITHGEVLLHAHIHSSKLLRGRNIGGIVSSGRCSFQSGSRESETLGSTVDRSG